MPIRYEKFETNGRIITLFSCSNDKLTVEDARVLAQKLVKGEVNEVNIYYSSIPLESMQEITRALPDANALEKLDLYFVTFDNIEASMINLALGLSKNRVLRDLKFQSNQITDLHLKTFVNILKETHVEKFEFDFYCLTSISALSIATFLSKAQNLSVVKFSGVSFDDPGFELIFKSMQGTKLREIVFYYSNQKFGPLAACALAEVLQDKQCVLKNLTLQQCKIGDDAAVHISKGLANNASLEKLILGSSESGNDMESKNRHEHPEEYIGAEGGKALASAIKVHSKLQHLDLNGHLLEDTAAQDLALAIKGNPRVVNLHLGNNKIGDSGAKALFLALILNKGITSIGGTCYEDTLNLHQNAIGDDAIEFLGSILGHLPHIEKICFIQIAVKPQGISAFLPALTNNITLHTLKFRDYKDMDPATLATKLNEVLQTNRSLRSVHFEDYNFSETNGTDENEIRFSRIPKKITDSLTARLKYNCFIVTLNALTGIACLEPNTSAIVLSYTDLLWMHNLQTFFSKKSAENEITRITRVRAKQATSMRLN